jgi:DNA-binding NtrC family response regulator
MHKKRKQSIDSLKRMMDYEGRFSILVLGDNGVGKTHWINQNIKELREGNQKDNKVSVDSALVEDSQDYWLGIFTNANNKFLIIEEVEKLSQKSQEVLFNILSTENGKYGLEKKDLVVRIIFTSCFPIKKLRDDKRFLNAKFYDRISQFVVTFPSFKETQRDILSYFEETWKKFFSLQHDYHDKYPKGEEFKKWLEEIAENMHGNFRDLDKIVINWNLHQVSSNNMTEDEIFERVKKDFKEVLKYPSQRNYSENTFVFDEDLKYGEIMDNFRLALKEWSLNVNFGVKREAARKLGISHRTMDRW